MTPWHLGAALAAAYVALLAYPSQFADARGQGTKRQTISEVIIHATGGPFCKGGEVAYSPPGTVESMARFFAKNGTVSIHYLVGRDGEVVKSLPEEHVAIHTVGHNAQAIGIELINAGNGQEPYPEPQLAALADLVHGIQARWRIPISEIKGHEDVDHTTFTCGGRVVRRKQDPGPRFPWDRFKLALMATARD